MLWLMAENDYNSYSFITSIKKYNKNYLIVRNNPFDLAPSNRSFNLGRTRLSLFFLPFFPTTTFPLRLPLLPIPVFLKIVFGVVIVLVDLKFVILFGNEVLDLPSLSF